MLCERPSRRSDAKELHFRILAQPGCVFLEVPYGFTASIAKGFKCIWRSATDLTCDQRNNQ